MTNTPCGIVFNEQGEVLLVHRRFPPKTWGPPGGFPEGSENPADTVEREVLEETGVTCVALAPLGDYLCEASDSRLLLYVCDYLFGTLRCSYESTDVGWYPLHSLPEMLSPPKEIFLKAYDLYLLSKNI